MDNTNHISNFCLKNFRRGKLLPVISVFLVVLLLSSPFVSIAWGESYNIIYVMDMGGINPNTITTYDNSVDTLILDAYDPVFKFMGWAVTYYATWDQNVTPAKNFVIPAGTTGTVELAAIFDTSPAGFAIDYELDGGTNNPNNRDRYFGDYEYFPITIYDPTKLGYTFLGWTAVYSDGTPELTVRTIQPRIVAGTLGEITFTAHWTPSVDVVDYVVNYYLVGTTTSVVDSVAKSGLMGASVTEFAVAVAGYTAVAPTSLTQTLAASGNVFTFYYEQELIPYTVTFEFGGLGGDIDQDDIDENYPGVYIPGDGSTRNDGKIVYTPVYYGDAMPVAPTPYAEFGYKFLGWKDDKGNFYEALDYTRPLDITPVLPTKVTGDVTFTAVWSLVDDKQTFPDKIPSAAHVDSWWVDYGVVCYASSNGATPYFIGFVDWFFDVYSKVAVGFGTQGHWDYVIDFTKDGAVWRNHVDASLIGTPVAGAAITAINANGFDFTVDNGDGYDTYTVHEFVTFDAKYTPDAGKNYNFGDLLGLWFVNPFNTGAKQAWLGAPIDLFDGATSNNPASTAYPEPTVPIVAATTMATATATVSGNTLTITVKDGETVAILSTSKPTGNIASLDYTFDGYTIRVVFANGGKVQSVQPIFP